MPVPSLTGLIRNSYGPVLVVIDGEEWGPLPRQVVRALELKEGRPCDPETLRQDAERVLPQCAMERALYLVSSRERSRAELCGRLVRDGYPSVITSEVADRLEEIGAIDDRRFAAAYVRSGDVKGYGRQRIERGLRDAGIDEEVLAEALESHMPLEDEMQRARDKGTALARSCRGDVARLAARLARRGFSPRVAWQAAREVLNDAAEDACLDASDFVD